jgi:hypothetical protein
MLFVNVTNVGGLAIRMVSCGFVHPRSNIPHSPVESECILTSKQLKTIISELKNKARGCGENKSGPRIGVSYPRPVHGGKPEQ